MKMRSIGSKTQPQCYNRGMPVTKDQLRQIAYCADTLGGGENCCPVCGALGQRIADDPEDLWADEETMPAQPHQADCWIGKALAE